MSRAKFLFFLALYISVFLLLSVYSYSQIDLNLTLSSNHFYQFLQKQLIYLGYYQRPISVSVYCVILSSLYILYSLTLFLIGKKKINFRQIITIITLACVFLFFSYPAFSYDIFNYMFDARIITLYHANPYSHSALNYPNDLWTRFMHWTHRTYPYGPVWILVTLPFSFLGFGKFVPTLLNFKLMFLLSYLLNVFLIYKIAKKITPTNITASVAFFALNPLVIIESIVSPHNEVLMLTFLLAAIYLFFPKKKEISGFLAVLLSAGIKYVTLLLLPIFIFHKFRKVGLSRWGLYILYLLTLLGIGAEIIYREPYPWYFIPLVGITALVHKNFSLKLFTVFLTLGAMLRYSPFIFMGDYSGNVLPMENLLFVLPVLTVFILVLLRRLMFPKTVKSI
ncbi:polyprenol phosphomannose-dependent alpha 1,6 mannosyltransferase MptB [Patescibacteria group bacterium]|nr:polyprenol phosphomannose-dependent alpha 1,6 mannosyltransferase MptB [Patescibacteria group bacterium]